MIQSSNFVDKQVHMKVFRRFWKISNANSEGKDYKEVLKVSFNSLCKNTVISH